MLILNLMFAMWIAALIVATSDGGISVPELLGITYGGGSLFLAWLIAVVVKRFKKQKTPFGTVMVAPSILVLGVVAFISDTAFLLRFYPSRAALNKYVSQVRDHPVEQSAERRVGLFVVRETEVLPGEVVRIITAEDMFDHTGVVYSAVGKPPRVGEDSYEEIGRGWWRWWRSW